MTQPDANSRPRRGLWTAVAAVALAGATAITMTLPGMSSAPDQVQVSAPVELVTTFAPLPLEPPPPAPPAPPLDPNAPPPPPPPPLDPNAPPPPPPLDPNAPPPPPPLEPGRVVNEAGGLSYFPPEGWTVADGSQLTYGSALLTKESAPDSRILLGRLDLKLFAGAEPDNTKAAIRLASDMGEFFMPFPGTRVSPEIIPLDAAGMPGTASYYEVKFTDTTKPNGQIWAGVVGNSDPAAPRVARNTERWFVVWLGTGKNPVDRGAAKALADSIRPWYPPPPPPPPDPNAPPPPPDPNAPPPDPNAPPVRPGVGVPVPVEAPVPGMSPPA